MTSSVQYNDKNRAVSKSVTQCTQRTIARHSAAEGQYEAVVATLYCLLTDLQEEGDNMQSLVQVQETYQSYR